MREVTLIETQDTKMRKLIIFSVYCLVGVLRAAPVSDEDVEKVEVPESVYDKSFVKYKAEHNIVDILVPLNALNFASTDSSSESESNENVQTDLTVFFVEADVNNGRRVDHGLYRYKSNKAKNILPTGRSAAASTNNNKLVFFGASDGLYAYDVDSDSAVKHGPITDGIISIATDENGNHIYILTDDHKLYKVTNNGETKEEVDNVKDAKEIVLDDSNNIYYYTSKNEVFIRTDEGVHKVESLPPNPQSIKLIRPPFLLNSGIGVLHDNSIYTVYSNGTTAEFEMSFSQEARPTALGPEAILVQYYAHNKKLYEYNILAIMSNDIFANIKVKAGTVRDNANKSKNTLGTKKS